MAPPVSQSERISQVALDTRELARGWQKRKGRSLSPSRSSRAAALLSNGTRRLRHDHWVPAGSHGVEVTAEVEQRIEARVRAAIASRTTEILLGPVSAMHSPDGRDAAASSQNGRSASEPRGKQQRPGSDHQPTRTKVAFIDDAPRTLWDTLSKQRSLASSRLPTATTATAARPDSAVSPTQLLGSRDDRGEGPTRILGRSEPTEQIRRSNASELHDEVTRTSRVPVAPVPTSPAVHIEANITAENGAGTGGHRFDVVNGYEWAMAQARALGLPGARDTAMDGAEETKASGPGALARRSTDIESTETAEQVVGRAPSFGNPDELGVCGPVSCCAITSGDEIMRDYE